MYRVFLNTVYLQQNFCMIEMFLPSMDASLIICLLEITYWLVIIVSSFIRNNEVVYHID